jgi:hypothetical protein
MNTYEIGKFFQRGKMLPGGEVLYVVRDDHTVFYVGQSRHGAKARIRSHAHKLTPLGKLILEHAPRSNNWLVDIYAFEEARNRLADGVPLGSDGGAIDASFEQICDAYLAARSVSQGYTLQDVEQFLIAQFRPTLNQLVYASWAVINHKPNLAL